MINEETEGAPYFLGLDIGSGTCKAVLSAVRSWDTFDFEVIAAAEHDSGGSVERGAVVNMEKAASVIQNLASDLYGSSSLSEDSLVFGAFSIQNQHVTSRVNRAKYPFSKYPREVKAEDLLKAREMASNFPLQNGRDYVHIMPRSYAVDGRLPKRYPEGELGLSVESEVFLVSAQQQELIKYKQCAERVGIPLDYVCAGAIAAAEGVLTKLEKEQTTVLIDIGAQTTSGVIFDAQVPKALAVVPLGSNDVTRDISRLTHVPASLAEKLKISYTCVDETYFEHLEESVTAREENYDQAFTIKTSELYQIAYARMYEIFKLLYASLQISDVAHVYPAVLTGGGSRIVGCKQMLEKLTGAKVRMAQPWNWGGPVSDYRTPGFSVAVGLCAAAARHYIGSFGAEAGSGAEQNVHYAPQRLSRPEHRASSMKTFFNSVGNKMKRFFSFGEIET